jgi:acylphosphatase
MAARQIFYKGRVQGVGFRYSVKQIAMGYDVAGWIRNLPDGRVELQVKGETDEVNDFLEAIRTSHLASHITNEEPHALPDIPGVRGFEIRQ